MLQLAIAHKAPGVSVVGMNRNGEYALRLGFTSVGSTSMQDIRINGALIGGHTNFVIETTNEGSFVCHTGHGIAVLLNGEDLRGGPPIQLKVGDCIEPIDARTKLTAVIFLIEDGDPTAHTEDISLLRK